MLDKIPKFKSIVCKNNNKGYILCTYEHELCTNKTGKQYYMQVNRRKIGEIVGGDKDGLIVFTKDFLLQHPDLNKFRVYREGAYTVFHKIDLAEGEDPTPIKVKYVEDLQQYNEMSADVNDVASKLEQERQAAEADKSKQGENAAEGEKAEKAANTAKGSNKRKAAPVESDLDETSDELERTSSNSDVSARSFNMTPVAVMRSPYGQKFAVPRQPGLASSVKSTIEFFAPYSDPQAFVGLETFSHIHVIFVFDKVYDDKFRPMIRPPRLGGNQKVGVYGSRSPFRPNHIGLSVMKLTKVENRNGKVVLHVLGADLVDGTPILDVKPYIPFVDAIKDAEGGFASQPPALKEVVYEPRALAVIEKQGLDKVALTEIMAQDPRPAYKGEDDVKEYFALLMGYNVKFVVENNKIIVQELLTV